MISIFLIINTFLSYILNLVVEDRMKQVHETIKKKKKVFRKMQFYKKKAKNIHGYIAKERIEGNSAKRKENKTV